MKKNICIPLLMLFAILFVGCSDEDSLTPSELEISRYDFPQGSESWDKNFDKIYQEHGTQLLYKEFTQKDLNKNWVEDPFGAVNESSWDYYKEDSTDTLQVLSEYLKNRIFAYLNPEISKQTFKQYIYLLNRYQNKTTFGPVVNITPLPLTTEGIDNWIVSLPAALIYNENPTDEQKHIRDRIIAEYFKTAFARGVIAAPKGFGNDVDYTTLVETSKTDSPDYFLTRGFVHFINYQVTKASQMRSIPQGYKAEMMSKLRSGADFTNYIVALIFDPDFNNTYKDYPLILKRAATVSDYMKDKYDIDLTAIAQSN